MSSLPPQQRRVPVSTLPPARPPLDLGWRRDLGTTSVRIPPVSHGDLVAARCGQVAVAVRVHDGEEVWRYEAGDADDEGALAATGTALVVVTTGDDAADVRALDWSSGRELWGATLPGAPARRGISVGQDVQLLTETDEEMMLHSLDPVTGEVQRIWDVPPGCTALLARAGHTLVGARFPLAEDSGLYRLDTATGDLAQLLSDNVWSLHRGDVADLVSCGTYGSPESAFVMALDPRSGEPLWRQPAMTELVAVDGPDVACAENTGGVQQVVLRDAATGAEIWRTEPHDLEYAGLVFFTGDAVGVIEDDGLWFTDRATGADLGVVEVEDMWTSALTVTPAGIVLALGDGLGLLRPPA